MKDPFWVKCNPSLWHSLRLHFQTFNFSVSVSELELVMISILVNTYSKTSNCQNDKQHSNTYLRWSYQDHLDVWCPTSWKVILEMNIFKFIAWWLHLLWITKPSFVLTATRTWDCLESKIIATQGPSRYGFSFVTAIFWSILGSQTRSDSSTLLVIWKCSIDGKPCSSRRIQSESAALFVFLLLSANNGHTIDWTFSNNQSILLGIAL